MADKYGSYEDFIPLEHGVWYFRPGAAITKGSPVKVTADGNNLGEIEVQEAAADEPCIGYAMEAATGANDPRTIRVMTRFRAIAKATASAAITRGDAVTPAGSDKVKSMAGINEGGTTNHGQYVSKAFSIALQSPAADADTFAVGLF